MSVQPRGGQPLDETRIPAAIRNLLVGSVAGLKPEAVTVIDLSTGRSYVGTSGDGGSGGMAGQYTELAATQREFQQMISRLLGHIPGVLVTTSVELDPEISNERDLDRIRRHTFGRLRDA